MELDQLELELTAIRRHRLHVAEAAANNTRMCYHEREWRSTYSVDLEVFLVRRPLIALR